MNRLAAHRARHDTREWQVKRRERTRHLIELGGLVVKAGLVELIDDDRAVLLGLLVEAANKLQGADREQALALWRRRGKRALADDADAAQGSPLTRRSTAPAMPSGTTTASPVKSAR
ncbi:conjugal transfer protein TraD [Novosphingobium fluoreni]|uniref:conjugal transfer protein TraD n=1 Tax=Novosphingobium fluoreni TaxID=1391222 RepID=UPI00161DB195|nr:conjugal transfer protein TraD [Novosphingobium fluoreni]